MDRRLIDAFEIKSKSAVRNLKSAILRLQETRDPEPPARGIRRYQLCPELDKSGFIKKLYEQK